MSDTQAPPQIALQIKRTFNVPRERVFRAWTNPQELAAWFSPSPDITIVVPELDLRVGGRCRVEMHHKSGDVRRLSSIYREVDPPKKISFTWQWEPAADRAETLVTVEFHDLGKSTEIVLTHERFVSLEEKERHNQGWMGCFDQLGNFLT